MDTSPQFEACLPFVLKEEGTTFSNTPGDHGGATRYGITQDEYNIYRHFKVLPLQSVNLITKDEYTEIYWTSYWQPHCPLVPIGLDLSLFNINVNGGSGRGTRLIQQALGISVDGIWGPATTAAVAAMTPVDLIDVIQSFHDDERGFYQAIINHDPSQKKFASDWFGRNDRCELASLGMVKKGPMV
jgi:lysozyme family protein